MSVRATAVSIALAAFAMAGCRELDRFTTEGDHFEGTVVSADFVRSGVPLGTRLCLTIDAARLEDGPGQISTNDGLLVGAPLRPIPQLENDSLSNFTFGDGHIKNLMYSVHANANTSSDAGAPSTFGDVLVVVALLQSNDVEVRLLRGAPELGTSPDAGPANGSLFAVFPLTRSPGPCSF